MQPLILLSNDDGYDARGLVALRAELERFAEVIVCAPATNQSASSHSLTLSTVLRMHRFDDHTFAVNGTPADCIYVALHSKQRLLPRWPDMVVSGMNHGPNLGVDVIYSGTVAAAREAAQRGIPAVAVSADARADRQRAAALGARIAKSAWQHVSELERQPMAPLLNVNIPPGDRWQVVPTRIGRRLYADDVIYRRDPRDREYLWIGGSDVTHDRAQGTDTDAWELGHASVTPLTLDLFAHHHARLSTTVVDGIEPPAISNDSD
jgi:5'-nucleotidase